jgi:hypothetical protein
MEHNFRFVFEKAEAYCLTLVDLLISLGSAGLAVFSMPTVLNKGSSPKKNREYSDGRYSDIFRPAIRDQRTRPYFHNNCGSGGRMVADRCIQACQEDEVIWIEIMELELD